MVINSEISIQDQILEIVKRFSRENKIIEFDKLFRICRKELNLKSYQIEAALDSLIQEKQVIFGKKLVRELLLANSSRKKIYYFLKEYPGSKFSEIKDQTGLEKAECYWHLAILMKYECIKANLIQKTRIYGIDDDSNDLILLSHFLRNPIVNKIMNILAESPASIQDLVKIYQIQSRHCYYYCQILADLKILEISMRGSDKTFQINSNKRKSIVLIIKNQMTYNYEIESE